MNSICKSIFCKRLLFIVFTLLISTGCSTNYVDKGYLLNLGKSKRVALVEYKSSHAGSSSAQFWGGAIGNAIAASNKDEDYVNRLDNECQETIEQVLSVNSLFMYTNEYLKDAPELLDIDEMIINKVGMGDDEIEAEKERIENKNTSSIKHFVVSNNLNGALKIDVEHTFAGISSKLALQVYWTIYNKDGEKRVDIMTKAIDKDGHSWANTWDPKLEQATLELAKKNAEMFIAEISK